MANWRSVLRAGLGRNNLAGEDLSGLNGKTRLSLLRNDMTGVNLMGANLRGTDLDGVDLSSADLRGADLRGTNLEGARLDYATIDDSTRFDGASIGHPVPSAEPELDVRGPTGLALHEVCAPEAQPELMSTAMTPAQHNEPSMGIVLDEVCSTQQPEWVSVDFLDPATQQPEAAVADWTRDPTIEEVIAEVSGARPPEVELVVPVPVPVPVSARSDRAGSDGSMSCREATQDARGATGLDPLSLGVLALVDGLRGGILQVVQQEQRAMAYWTR